MFAVFSDNNFIGFWANKKEDNWAGATIQKMKIQNPQIFWYEKGDYNAPEFFQFDLNFNLQILKKETVTKEDGTTEEILEVIETLQAETYSF